MQILIRVAFLNVSCAAGKTQMSKTNSEIGRIILEASIYILKYDNISKGQKFSKVKVWITLNKIKWNFGGLIQLNQHLSQLKIL